MKYTWETCDRDIYMGQSISWELNGKEEGLHSILSHYQVYWVEECCLKIHAHLELVTVSLFENQVFADVSRCKLRWGHTEFEWAIKPVNGVLIRGDIECRENESSVARILTWPWLACSLHVWAIPCYWLYIKSSAQCSGLCGCRRAEAGAVAALRTESEPAVGAESPEAETGLLHAHSLWVDRILVLDLPLWE